MKLGEVYKWNTIKAKGHDNRDKYHIFIRPSDQEGDNTFLFINSADWFQDYKLPKSPNHGYLEYDSYVSCSSTVEYTDDELAKFEQTPVGQLTKEELKGLRDALIAAETMVTRDLNRVCKALASAL
jgi:hypothetical protein